MLGYALLYAEMQNVKVFRRTRSVHIENVCANERADPHKFSVTATTICPLKKCADFASRRSISREAKTNASTTKSSDSEWKSRSRPREINYLHTRLEYSQFVYLFIFKYVASHTIRIYLVIKIAQLQFPLGTILLQIYCRLKVDRE